MATYHGGDGGNEDPWNPNRLPSGCESSQPKKRRSKGKNLTLYKKYEQNNKKPLPLAVTTDEDQYRFVGDNSSDFIRLTSNEVRKTVPFYYASWQDVPNEYKHAIYPTLFEFFDLQALQDEGLWEGVKLGINAECARSYKDRKQKAKNHFLANGGYENIEKAKNSPPEYMNQSEWVELIDKLFKSDAYMKRSEKNKANRSKQRYPSYHGSESYSQKRWTKVKGVDIFVEWVELLKVYLLKCKALIHLNLKDDNKIGNNK
ncbi:hypothetical protein R6Q59_023812 [Mikania micrantha]